MKELEKLLEELKGNLDESIDDLNELAYEFTLNKIGEIYAEGNIDDVIDSFKNKIFKKVDINELNFVDAINYIHFKLKIANDMMCLKKLENNKEDALKLNELLFELMMDYRTIIKQHMED